jgi:Cu+-exporting ATPase
MSVAVVFDSAGTLLSTYRVAKDVARGELLPGVETTMLTFRSPERVLTVIHVHSKEVIESPPEMLLSEHLVERRIGFGISCTKKVITAEEVAEVLYHDRAARIGDLQDCIRDVWSICRQEAILMMNSGVILNMATRTIEFAVTTGGWPFPGAKDTITALHKMGVATYIASGDRTAKLERMADHLGVPRNRVYGVATPSLKAQIICDLKEEYGTVVMVGDGINDLAAMRIADVAILSEQQSGDKPKELLDAADHVVTSVCQVVTIVKGLVRPGHETGSDKR